MLQGLAKDPFGRARLRTFQAVAWLVQAVSLEMITMPVTPMDSSPVPSSSPPALTPKLTPRKLSKLGHAGPQERSAGLIPAWTPGECMIRQPIARQIHCF